MIVSHLFSLAVLALTVAAFHVEDGNTGRDLTTDTQQKKLTKRDTAIIVDPYASESSPSRKAKAIYHIPKYRRKVRQPSYRSRPPSKIIRTRPSTRLRRPPRRKTRYAYKPSSIHRSKKYSTSHKSKLKHYKKKPAPYSNVENHSYNFAEPNNQPPQDFNTDVTSFDTGEPWGNANRVPGDIVNDSPMNYAKEQYKDFEDFPPYYKSTNPNEDFNGYRDDLYRQPNHDSAASGSVVVGGQYAEPPARYYPLKPNIPDLKEHFEEYKLPKSYLSDVVSPSFTSSYVNYKNSNMAFSPQNLNDAFSIVD